jgi:hypothetical protein
MKAFADNVGKGVHATLEPQTIAFGSKTVTTAMVTQGVVKTIFDTSKEMFFESLQNPKAIFSGFVYYGLIPATMPQAAVAVGVVAVSVYVGEVTGLNDYVCSKVDAALELVGLSDHSKSNDIADM